MEKKGIGAVGLGLMGSGMAKNLLSAGYPVLVYDIDPQKMEALQKEGGKTTEFPSQIPSQVDVILLSLPNSYVVNDVVQSSLKLFETGKKGLILIDTTTADPILSKELSTRLAEKGIEMLDATVSGTSKMCAAREIIFMVGGREEIFVKCQPIFSALAKDAIFMGKNGAGALMKLLVSLVLGLHNMVLAEGLSLGKKAGMDQHRVLEVFKKSAAYSKAMDTKGARMVDREFLPPIGKLGLHLKDVRLILDLAARVNFPSPLVSLYAQALTSEVAKGRGDWDSADIISFYQELANV
jgi:2-hydroxy-3-oxopropionate reductase